MPENTTHFGYKSVASSEKESLVKEVFDSVTGRYDLMNDLMSLGLHRAWKRYVSCMTHLRPGGQALDIAAGTGDLTCLMSKQVGAKGSVISTDINYSMLNQGRSRQEDKGMVDNIHYTVANAEVLPFEDNQFDCITMAFGLRNVTDQLKALQSMLRVLRPGGIVLVLEFSHVKMPVFREFYDAYSFKILPKLGRLVGGDESAYQYLVESIRMHPDQDSLRELFSDAGFEQCHYKNIHGGVVAVHSGCKA